MTDYNVHRRVKEAISQTDFETVPRIFYGDIKDFDIFLSPHGSIFTLRNFIGFIEKNHVDDLVFVIAGCIDSDFEAFFDAEMASLGENGIKIIRVGYVENGDLASLYSHAECCVFVSLHEGFGLPPLEAIQCGCPVIASNVTSLPEVVDDAGILIDPTDDESMVAAYEKVYCDEKLQKELSQKGLKRAKNSSWKACVDAMVQEFKKT
ncbi:MAG: glycosyltransferase family 4 protein [Puniceicoccales bacterium]|nr:glycosyltransferase family 4 protein [Puniceicoccales bacterium]